MVVLSGSFKANTASVETIVVDEDTGTDKKRLINRMRWKGFGPVSVSYTEKNVSHRSIARLIRPHDAYFRVGSDEAVEPRSRTARTSGQENPEAARRGESGCCPTIMVN